KVIKLAAVIVGLFIATLAYLQYQRILNVDWHTVQALSQNGIEEGKAFVQEKEICSLFYSLSLYFVIG
ncbi:MAG: FUN14 domain-containing protein, partial [Candidatus Nitrosopolaris sp.]